MNIDIEAFLQSIILRSVTLEERITSYRKGYKFQETDKSSRRLIRWKEQFAKSGSEAFSNRIAALGLSPVDAAKVLGAPQSPGDSSLPEWAELLRNILQEIFDPDGRKRTRCFFAKQSPRAVPTVFAELYWPVIDCVSRRLKQEAGDVHLQLTEAAHADLEAHLLNRLLEAGHEMVDLQLAIFQTVSHFEFGDPSANDLRGETVSPQNFVGPVPGKYLVRLFAEYPVHARHCAVLALNWLNATHRLLARLTSDHLELSKRFNKGHSLGTVVSLQAGLSDPHHGGETVLLLVFSSGCKIIYKPRSVSAEQRFSELLLIVGSKGSFRTFKSPLTWDCGGYGWMEYIMYSPCYSLADVRRFYWRAGVLLGLIHLARGVDCHQENLIAQGEHPVLIDLDTLWHLQDLPQPLSRYPNDPRSQCLIDSVLRTGFLPGGGITESCPYSASALEGAAEERHVARPKVARHRLAKSISHLPFVGQSRVGAAKYTTEIMAGFRWTGRTILMNAERRTHFLHWLDQINQCPRRLIHRSTTIYATKLREACHPAMLKDGIDFSLVLQIPFATQVKPAIVKCEMLSLEQLDIPYFFQPPAPVASGCTQYFSHPVRYFSQLDVIRKALKR